MLRRCVCLLAVLVFGSVLLIAQTETGQITGVVKDSTGAVVPGATITAKSLTTGATRTVTSSADGNYAIPALKPAPYTVVVEATGFKKFERKVDVAVSANVDVSPDLTISGSSEVVEVNGGANVATVNIENQTVSSTVDSIALNQLPTSPEHDPYKLVQLSANVNEDTASKRGAGYSINGQRSSSTSILLDGAENVNYFDATVGQKIPLDAVQEFSVLTNNFGAEFGRASGGVVNVVSKSGTNEFHGSAYEYNRVSKLSSNTAYNNSQDDPKNVFTRNNFGFSLGGPIKKDKIFFFHNFEWLRVRSTATMPAVVLDPSSYGQLATNSYNYFAKYGKLKSGNQLKAQAPCDAGSSLTCDLVNYQTSADEGGGLPQNTWNQVSKVDWMANSKTTVGFRYASYRENDFAGTVNNSPYVGYDTAEKQMNHNFTTNVSRVITPNIVNATKFVYSRLEEMQPMGTAPVSPTLYTATSGLPTIAGLNSDQPLQFPGYYATSPGSALPFGGPQNLYQLFNDLSITKGRHNIKVGGQYVHIRDNRTFGAFQNAVEYLAPSSETALSDALTNLTNGNIYQYQGAMYPQGKYPCSVNIATGNLDVTPDCTLNLPISQPAFNRNFRYNDLAFYGQDSWKITPRLTVNGGLRWEYYGVQHNADKSLDSNFVMGAGANIYEQIRNGQVQLSKNGGKFWNPYYGGFGPRVGFAWDVFGNGKTSVSGGYSINYERNFGNVTFNAIQNPPNYGVIQVFSNANNTLPVYTDNAGPLSGSGTAPFSPTTLRAIDQHMKPAYAQTWNFGVEQEVAKNAVATVRYTGSHSLRLYDVSNINPDQVGGYLAQSAYQAGANCANAWDPSCTRINTQYGDIAYRSDHGVSFYNALILGLRANNLKNTGLTVNANYTWSHSLDTLSSTFTDAAGGQANWYAFGYVDPFNTRLNYGNSDFDIRHRMVVSANWQVPYFNNAQNKIVRNVAGGWTVGTIWNIRSGAPFSLYDCSNATTTFCPLYQGYAGMNGHVSGLSGLTLKTDPALVQNDPSQPNYNPLGLVNMGGSLGYPDCAGLYHTNCAYTKDGGAYPHRNQFFGPKYWNADLQLQKEMKIRERYRVELRGEFYNVLNHKNHYMQFSNLDVTSLSSNVVPAETGGIYGFAGQPTDERRNIQLGVHVQF
jgi:hypothetical protein